MKGMNKLILGLIILTVLCVGVKVEANAAEFILGSDNIGSAPDFANGDSLNGYIKFDTTDFPTAGSITSYNYTLLKTGGITPLKRGTIKFETKTIEGSDRYYATIDGNQYEDPFSTDPYALFSCDADTVRTDLTTKSNGQPETSGTVSKTFLLSAQGITPGSQLVNAGKVTAAAYGKSGNVNSKFNTNPIDPPQKYLFPNEEWFFASSDTIVESNITYRSKNWTSDPDIIDSSDKSSCTVTMIDPVETVTLKQIFASVSTSSSAVAVEDGHTTTNISYTRYGYELSDMNSSTVTLDDGTTITAAWANGNVRFTIPSGTTPGLHDVIVTMADENEYTLNSLLLVYGSGTVTLDPVSVTSGMTISLGHFSEDDYVVVSPSVTSNASPYVSLITPAGIRYLSAWKVKGGKETSSSGVNGIKIGADTTNVIVYPKPALSFGSSGSSSLSSGTTSNSSSEGSLIVTMPTEVYHDDIIWPDVTGARLEFEVAGHTKTEDITGLTTSGLKQTKSFTRSSVSNLIDSMLEDEDDDNYTVTIKAYPMNGGDVDTRLPVTTTITAYKISLDTSGGAKYTVNGSDKKGHFYVLDGTSITIKSSAARTGEKFQSWDDDVFSSESGGSYKVLGAKRFKANYSNGSSSAASSSSSSTSSSGRQTAVNGDSTGDDYDDVPKTGESKADIWILWSVLLVSILGAGFMIRKRFGLVRAIAAADEEMAKAIHEEKVETAKKEKESKIQMLKDLRKL